MSANEIISAHGHNELLLKLYELEAIQVAALMGTIIDDAKTFRVKYEDHCIRISLGVSTHNFFDDEHNDDPAFMTLRWMKDTEKLIRTWAGCDAEPSEAAAPAPDQDTPREMKLNGEVTRELVEVVIVEEISPDQWREFVLEYRREFETDTEWNAGVLFKKFAQGVKSSPDD